MSRILVTGSADGLGRAAAETLLSQGHEVVVHARNPGRAADLTDLVDRGARVVVGDFADRDAVSAVAAELADAAQLDAVDPGWVPTRMGGPGAPDDLELGHRTQEWLVTSDDPEALTTGGYWYHQEHQEPHAAVHDTAFQDRLLQVLAQETGTSL
jgi:hypothetical protein